MAAGRTASGTLVSNNAASVSAAHARLLRDHRYQFDFKAPTPPPKPPEWLEPLLRLIAKLAPSLQWVLWALLALGVAGIALLLLRELVLYRRPGRALSNAVDLTSENWRPSPARAQALLAEADRLAAEGRYDEAAHTLLHRSIDDIEQKRPRLVAAAHTSRDIATLRDLPEAARHALGVIVGHVERSLFGGRRLDAAAFHNCRRAYEAFAFPDQWQAGG